MPQFLILCFLLSSFVQFVGVFSSSTHHLCHLDEALSLLQFKKEMIDINSSFGSYSCDYYGKYSSPKMISWNKTSSDCCTWDGVTCHEITGHVIGLDLSCSRLMGVIHQNSTLFRLSYLQKLNLANNDFYPSKISTNIGRLSSLTHLNFSSCSFDGVIPSELSHLSKLVLLDLSYSDILSFSPRHFQILLRNLTSIRVLSLSYVQNFESLQGNWSSSLTCLDLGYTRVHGKLSKSIFHLPRLQKLILVGNENLSVSLPKSNYCSTPSLQVLDLSYTKFSSDRFADSLCSFAFLKSLSLSGCGLSGSFPNYIHNLSQITRLDLSSNNFTGNFPSVISSHPNLVEVDLGWNSFAGQFPSHIENLTELTLLRLDNNLLSGPLPFNMSVLPKLRTLQLSYNALDGTIPSWLFSNPSLTSLILSNNLFTGQIEEFIAKSLVNIDLSSNNLNGSIEFAMFSHLNELRYLQLSRNKLSFKVENKTNISFPDLISLGLSSCEITEFPSFLNNSKKLQFLDLSNNKLIGQIPYLIPWNSLNYLNLAHNLLSGLGSLNTLIGLGSFSTLIESLEVLDLSSNNLYEQLPLSICSFKRLYNLDLSRNNFFGAIPKCYGSFSNGLEVLNLAKNDLKGAISMNFPKDNLLKNLNLNANSLQGALPRSLANCMHMEVLDVGNNKINDTFPYFLENLTKLQVLILKSNKFFGRISNVKNENFLPKLRVFDLSCNEFIGVLPLELLKSFKAMMTLDMIKADGSYMGVIRGHGNEVYRYPASFTMKGQVVDFTGILTILVVIDLSSNNFMGDIPEIIGNLNSLIVLNLSHNNFSGHIPSTLGRLHFLESLDLSWNKIEGVIPWQLADLTSLEIMNLSQNCLVGPIPQGKQFNTFLNDSYYGNLGLCGFPVTINCGEIDLSLPPSQGSYQDDKDSCFCIGFTCKAVVFGTSFGFAIGCFLCFLGKPKWLVKNIEKVCWCGLLLLGERTMCKQLKRSRRRDRKHNKINN